MLLPAVPRRCRGETFRPIRSERKQGRKGRTQSKHKTTGKNQSKWTGLEVLGLGSVEKQTGAGLLDSGIPATVHSTSDRILYWCVLVCWVRSRIRMRAWVRMRAGSGLGLRSEEGLGLGLRLRLRLGLGLGSEKSTRQYVRLDREGVLFLPKTQPQTPRSNPPPQKKNNNNNNINNQ